MEKKWLKTMQGGRIVLSCAILFGGIAKRRPVPKSSAITQAPITVSNNDDMARYDGVPTTGILAPPSGLTP